VNVSFWALAIFSASSFALSAASLAAVALITFILFSDSSTASLAA
jgi:hypothetical protein